MPEFVVSASLMPLNVAIDKLSTIANISKQSPSEASDVFLSAILLLKELKRDRNTLRKIRSEKGSDAAWPESDRIPAISAVLLNPVLLRSLIRCLLTATGNVNDIQDSSAGSHASHQSNHHHTIPGTKKRTLSVAADASNDRSTKLFKHAHSPVPTARSKIQTNEVSRKTTASNFNVPVLAATILYASFQYVDHWPEQFVRAYAEDCFSSRLWVDDERCADFVANLALAHADDESGNNGSDHIQQQVDKGGVIAEYYKILDLIGTDSDAGDDDDVGTATSGESDKNVSKKIDVHSKLKSQKSSMSQDSLDSVAPKTSTSEKSEEENEERKSRLSTKDGSDPQGQDENDFPNAIVPKAISDTAITSNAKKSRHENDFYSAIQNHNLTLLRIRQRYFGVNLLRAHESIASSLHGRLEQKSRQNSGLLQSLPFFTAIPAVRCMIAENLEQWLKSPALAGLARNLFSMTVNHMKNTDPPLEEDMKAVDFILSMKLKANQLNAHIENVTAIARRIPVASVAHHMYSNLIREALNLSTTIETSNSSELRMIGAIHKEINPIFSYDSIAAVLLTLLVNPDVHQKNGSKNSRRERDLQVKKLRYTIQAIANELGSTFDGCQLIAALLSFDVNSDSWSIQDEKDKARLMFQCALCSYDVSKLEVSGVKQSHRQSLIKSKKLFLTWCCSDFGPRFKKNKSSGINSDEDVFGAGEPDYHSSLGFSNDDDEEGVPSWLTTMRCVLFLQDPESTQMKRFLVPDGLVDESEWNDEVIRIKFCAANGADLSDDLIWIVLKAASLNVGGIDSLTALLLLENLFENCSKNHNGKLKVTNPIIAWEMYNLVEYVPSKPVSMEYEGKKDNDKKHATKQESHEINSENLPRLAHPGMWWRATMLVLIMTGVSPKNIGSLIWNDHPTVQALIKMITSNRYRFPPVDCDETTKTSMKVDEKKARDKETKIAEFLFLPKKEEKKKTDNKGQRVSRRILKQQQEKEAEDEIAETNKRRNLLKNAQKTIMLWDPNGPARKPPPSCVDLLLSVTEMFGLTGIFQNSTEPDFLLMTIGQTSRSAIERAYDWLIPIISLVPNTISRLPSSASCFLLLRAYGTGGDERKLLKQLSAPLLIHVRESLNGKYGEVDSVKAFDLLMTDVASSTPERRRCARRVLQDALEEGNSADSSRQSWMLSILKVDFSTALVEDAIKHMSVAATFERGRVLQALLLALQKHFQFALDNQIIMDVSFADRLFYLVSSRPGICAEAMDSFPDLWGMITGVAAVEFLFRVDPSLVTQSTLSSVDVIVTLANTEQRIRIKLSTTMLQSICVCLSVWKDQEANMSSELLTNLNSLADAFLISDVINKDERGLSSARLLVDKTNAVTVESWVMLAKARSNTIARRAALSAPASFLPRLLLCSGLPRASFVTMVERLGHLGDSATSKDKLYLELLVQKASSEWDIGRVGNRLEFSRNLLGRLSAYMRLFKVSQDEVSSTFLFWLAQEAKSNHEQIAQKQKSKKERPNSSPALISLAAASSILELVGKDKPGVGKKAKLHRQDIEMNDFMSYLNVSNESSIEELNMADITDVVETFLQENNTIGLDRLMDTELAKYEKHLLTKEAKEPDMKQTLLLFLKYVKDVESQQDGMTLVLFKWIPCLSRYFAVVDIWKHLFLATEESAPSNAMDALAMKCIASWTKEQASSCGEWIMSECKGNMSDFDLNRVTYLLVVTSDHSSSQIDDFDGNFTHFPKTIEWRNSKGFTSTATSIALANSRQSSDNNKVLSCCTRNSLPTWLTLILLLSKTGKVQSQTVVESILKALHEPNIDSLYQTTLEACLLRIYLQYPYWMDLGSSVVRTFLMKASEKHFANWVFWRSSTDDIMQEMINSVLIGELRVSRSISEFSRRHPLLLLRRLPVITAALEYDATYKSDDYDDNKGLIIGQSISDPVEAIIDRKSIKVVMKHWGYSFTEPIWGTFLDICSSIPREVLFSCGTKVGLLEFLGLYLQLMSVQLQLVTASKVSRLKGKMSECFKVFQQTNPIDWKRWLNSKVEETEVRYLLISCTFITSEEAIESIKNT